MVLAIDNRELCVQHVIDDAFMGFAGFEIKAPFIQQKIALALVDGVFQPPRIQLAVGQGVQPVRGTHHHDFVIFFPGIDNVQHVARFGFKPANIVGRAITWNHRKARWLISMKANLVSFGL